MNFDTALVAGRVASATVFGYSPAEAGHDAPAVLPAAGALTVFTYKAALLGLMAGFTR